VLTSFGGFGTSAQKNLKHIGGHARENSCGEIIVGQSDIQTKLNTPHASTYCKIRLSVAGAGGEFYLSIH